MRRQATKPQQEFKLYIFILCDLESRIYSFHVSISSYKTFMLLYNIYYSFVQENLAKIT